MLLQRFFCFAVIFLMLNTATSVAAASMPEAAALQQPSLDGQQHASIKPVGFALLQDAADQPAGNWQPKEIALQGADEINQQPASGEPAGNWQPKEIALQDAADQPVSDEQPKEIAFSCETTSRDAAQRTAQGLQNALKDGFTGNEISSGTEPNKEREKLQQDTLILEDPETGDAAKQTVPNEEIDISEVSHLLNTNIKGAFAFGLVLDDSMRIGRCEKDANCHLTGDDMYYRNSGTAFQTAKRSAYEAVGEIWDGAKDAVGLDKVQNERLRAWLSMNDENEATITEMKRARSNYIPNSIKTSLFDAKMQTNCVNSACVISTYSLFDKYFNVWYSGTLVLSNFGPTLYHGAKKAFGLIGRRFWPWRISDMDIVKRLRASRLLQPSSLIRQMQAKSIFYRADKYALGEVTAPLVEGDTYYLIKSGSFNIWWSKEIAKKGGFLDSVTDPTRRKALLRIANDYKRYASSNDAVISSAEKAYSLVKNKFGPNSAEEIAARIGYGRTLANLANEMDDYIGLDWPEFWMRHSASGFRNFAFKNADTGQIHVLYEDSRNFRIILEKFAKDGDWKGMSLAADKLAFERSAVSPGNLQLYKASPQGARIHSASITDLKAGVAKGEYIENFAKLANGDFVPVTSHTLPLLEEMTVGNVELYRAGWEAAGELTPEMLASSLTQSRAMSRFKRMKPNAERMYDSLVERNFGGRQYTSILDKAFAEEPELIKKYFTLKGAAKWTAAPYAYWWMKKGLGNEDFSAYQLPDTWRELSFTTGSEQIYSDAYVDFFANEGSDQGDLFVQVLNALPWKMVLNAASEQYNPVKNLYDTLTKNELRSEAEDLAFFFAGPEECAGCSVTIASENLEDFSPHFIVGEKFKGYVLEDTRTEAAIKKGQTIIAFAHHTDLQGKTTGEAESGKIGLVEAIKKKETCTDKVKDLPHILTWGSIGPGAGAALGTMESVSYLIFGWGGIFSTAYMQTLITPKLQDCVDAEEGYYAHYFAPAKKEEKKQQDLVAVSSEKVNESIKEFKKRWLDSFSANDESAVGKAVKNVGKSIEKFVKNSEEKNMVQATLGIAGLSEGQMKGKKLFYFWCQGGCEMYKSKYDTETTKVIKDAKGNEITLNAKDAKLTYNGKEIPIEEEKLRAATGSNLSIPAEEIAQTITTVSVPISEEKLLEIDVHGQAFVRNTQVLECMRSSVFAQTGIAMPGDNLMYAFGKVESVATTSHPNVVPDGMRIIAEGNPRKVAEGGNSKIEVLSNMQTSLLNSSDGKPDIGRLLSIQFKNGTIIVKPETNQLIIWLRHHEKGIMEQKDVRDLKSELTKIKNPETGCEENALDLQVVADPESPRAMESARTFNQSMKHMGPFQVFETDSKRYVFYNGPAPACEPHLKIIDKATGNEIADYVLNNLRQTPAGIEFEDQDGKKHTLDFTAENGVPMLKFDSEAPETLRAATGKNGSFWYDPDKGLWYAENAQLLPLLEAFKRDGYNLKGNPDGTVTATGGSNIMNVQVGGEDGSWLNLPSLPESAPLLVVFILALLAAFCAARMAIYRKK